MCVPVKETVLQLSEVFLLRFATKLNVSKEITYGFTALLQTNVSSRRYNYRYQTRLTLKIFQPIVFQNPYNNPFKSSSISVHPHLLLYLLLLRCSFTVLYFGGHSLSILLRPQIWLKSVTHAVPLT